MKTQCFEKHSDLKFRKFGKRGKRRNGFEMRWLGKNYTSNELWGLIVIVVVILVVFVVIMVQMQRWYYRDENAFKLTKVTPPQWLLPILIGAILGLVAYGGYTIFSQEESEMRGICIALWIASVVTLLAVSTAFFVRDLPVEASYLMLLFISLHAAITYKFYRNRMDAVYAYIPSAAIAIYLCFVLMTYIKK